MLINRFQRLKNIISRRYSLLFISSERVILIIKICSAEIDSPDRDTHAPRSKFCKCCKWSSLVWTKFLMTESGETGVLTPAPWHGISGHSLKSDNTRWWWSLFPCTSVQYPSSEWPETRKKDVCRRQLTRDMMWRVTGAWHHNTWHQGVGHPRQK